MRYLIEFTDAEGLFKIRTNNKVLAGDLFLAYGEDLKTVITMTDIESKTKEIKNYW